MSLQCTPNTYFEFGCPFRLPIGVGLRQVLAGENAAGGANELVVGADFSGCLFLVFWYFLN
jgi:hypothetical protein